MRLADLIRTDIESILENWEEFAQRIVRAGSMDRDALHDHARGMLLTIADDLARKKRKPEHITSDSATSS